MSDNSEKWLSQFAKGQSEIFRLLILLSQQSETQQYSMYRDIIQTKGTINYTLLNVTRPKAA